MPPSSSVGPIAASETHAADASLHSLCSRHPRRQLYTIINVAACKSFPRLLLPAPHTVARALQQFAIALDPPAVASYCAASRAVIPAFVSSIHGAIFFAVFNRTQIILAFSGYAALCPVWYWIFVSIQLLSVPLPALPVCPGSARF